MILSSGPDIELNKGHNQCYIDTFNLDQEEQLGPAGRVRDLGTCDVSSAAAACDHVQCAQYVQSTRAQRQAGTMREKDECGPNIGLVRLLIYLCQADFNTGSPDLSRLSPSPDAAPGVNTEHLNRKQLYLCACITTERSQRHL